MNRIGFSQRLELRQTQALVMTPQLQQAIKMLQLSNLELADYVDTEIEQNPLLERSESDGEDGTPAAEVNGHGPEPETAAPIQTASTDLAVDAAEQWDATAGADGDGTADFGGDTLRWRIRNGVGGDDLPMLEQIAMRPRTLREHLLEQIGADMQSQTERVIAAFLLGITPFFWTFVPMFLCEIPFLAFFAAAVWLFYFGIYFDQRCFLWSWISCALAFLTRHTAVLFFPIIFLFVCLAWWWGGREARARIRSRAFLLSPLAGLLLFLPWLARAYFAFGDPLAGLKLALQGRALVGERQAGHRQAAGQRRRRLDEPGQRLGAGGQRLRFEISQIAPMMRRGFIQRRLQIVAQGDGQRRFIARLHRHRIDQRREQAFAFGMQQIAQRLYFGGQTVDFAFRRFQRLARKRLCGFGIGMLFTRFQGNRTSAL